MEDEVEEVGGEEVEVGEEVEGGEGWGREVRWGGWGVRK